MDKEIRISFKAGDSLWVVNKEARPVEGNDELLAPPIIPRNNYVQ